MMETKPRASRLTISDIIPFISTYLSSTNSIAMIEVATPGTIQGWQRALSFKPPFLTASATVHLEVSRKVFIFNFVAGSMEI